MKRKYIKPQIVVISIERETLMGLSNQETSVIRPSKENDGEMPDDKNDFWEKPTIDGTVGSDNVWNDC